MMKNWPNNDKIVFEKYKTFPEALAKIIFENHKELAWMKYTLPLPKSFYLLLLAVQLLR